MLHSNFNEGLHSKLTGFNDSFDNNLNSQSPNKKNSVLSNRQIKEDINWPAKSPDVTLAKQNNSTFEQPYAVNRIHNNSNLPSQGVSSHGRGSVNRATIVTGEQSSQHIYESNFQTTVDGMLDNLSCNIDLE